MASFARRLFSVFAILFSVSGLSVSGVWAQEKFGDYQDWSVFTFDENGSKVCYMSSQPLKAEGNYTRRGEIFFMVTHRPGSSSKDVSNFVAGYTFKTGSNVSVFIDRKPRFSMFTSDDNAWVLDEDDKPLLQAMVRGNKMVIKGTSSRGTLTTDTFSLSGFTKAYRAISSACNVKPTA